MLATNVNSDRRRLQEVGEAGFYNHYQDKGCDVSPSCLKCPLDKCKHDDHLAYLRQRNKGFYFQILECIAAGATTSGTAMQLSVTKRTVFRALEWARKTIPLHIEAVQSGVHDAGTCGCGTEAGRGVADGDGV